MATVGFRSPFEFQALVHCGRCPFLTERTLAFMFDIDIDDGSSEWRMGGSRSESLGWVQ